MSLGIHYSSATVANQRPTYEQWILQSDNEQATKHILVITLAARRKIVFPDTISWTWWNVNSIVSYAAPRVGFAHVPVVNGRMYVATARDVMKWRLTTSQSLSTLCRCEHVRLRQWTLQEATRVGIEIYECAAWKKQQTPQNNTPHQRHRQTNDAHINIHSLHQSISRSLTKHSVN
jgi:hypothetical protein